MVDNNKGMSIGTKLMSTAACVAMVVILNNVDAGTIGSVLVAIVVGVGLEIMISKAYHNFKGDSPTCAK